MRKVGFCCSGWWWSTPILVLLLGLTIVLELARASVGSAVEGVAEDLAEPRQQATSAADVADVIARARREVRQAQIDNLAAILCKELRLNNFRISDDFFAKFRAFVAKENALSQGDLGERFDPKYEASSEPSAISIVDRDIQHVYSCKLSNPRPDSKLRPDSTEDTSCLEMGGPLNKRLMELLVVVDEASKEVPGVVITCRAHQKKSEVGGVCIGRCPDDRPFFIGSGGDPTLQADEMEARANFIEDNCSACPEDRPYYDGSSNKCLSCNPSATSSTAESSNQKATCVECPYGFELTEDKQRCRGTAKACAVCQRAAQEAANWSVQEFLDMSANSLPGCDREELRENLENGKGAAYESYRSEYLACVERVVDKEFELEESKQVGRCPVGVGINMGHSVLAMACFDSVDLVRKTSQNDQSEFEQRLKEPNIDLIRLRVEAGR